MSRSADGQSLLEISGEIGREAKPHRERKALVEPDLWTGRVLKAALMKRGVPVGPIAVTAQAIGSTQRVRPLARVDDQGLSGTVKDINTWSNNFMAESLMLGLGCDVALPCQWQRASSRVEGFFDDLKVPKAERQIVNGSGLYLASKLSARAITHLLVFMADDQVFLDSLAVPGRPGTLSGRLRALGRGPRLRAKTGMLDEVVSLAGYLTTRGGKTLAFAVLVNGATSKRTHALKRRIDKLVSRLASSKAPR
jgi:D-alanyl-D-alanine carboxypeptidase/D-alanyl-D-alanine-endopeptidase (penicillin-binding protein 4)